MKHNYLNNFFFISLNKDNLQVKVRIVYRWLNIIEWVIVAVATIILITSSILSIFDHDNRVYNSLAFASIPIVSLEPVNAYQNAKAIKKLKAYLTKGFLPSTPYNLIKIKKMLKSYNVKENYFN